MPSYANQLEIGWSFSLISIVVGVHVVASGILPMIYQTLYS